MEHQEIAINYKALGRQIVFQSTVGFVAYRWLGREAFIGGARLSLYPLAPKLFMGLWQDRNFLEERMEQLRQCSWEHYGADLLQTGVTLGFFAWWDSPDPVARSIGLFFTPRVLEPVLLTFMCSHAERPHPQWREIIAQWHEDGDQAWNGRQWERRWDLCAMRCEGVDQELIDRAVDRPPEPARSQPALAEDIRFRTASCVRQIVFGVSIAWVFSAIAARRG